MGCGVRVCGVRVCGMWGVGEGCEWSEGVE